MKYIPLFCLALILVSCHHPSKKELIVGTWKAISPQKFDGRMLVFLKNNVAVAKREGDVPSGQDSVNYKISDDGTKLTTTETNGRTDELEIIKLTSTDMHLFLKGSTDTFHFKKQ